MWTIFHVLCAGNVEGKVAVYALVSVRKVLDEVIVTKKTKAPVDQREKKKDTRDNLPFCDKYDKIYIFRIEYFYLLS